MAILRDARQEARSSWMRSVGSEFRPSDLIGFMESIHYPGDLSRDPPSFCKSSDMNTLFGSST
jgi:hypothetical protein